MARMVASILFAVIAATGSSLSQESSGRTKSVPRATFTWPDDATPQIVIYEVAAWNSNGSCGGGSSGSYSGQGKQVVVGALCGTGSVQHANLAIYASGCQSKRFYLDLTGSVVSERLQCDPLPNKTLRGFIPPDQIPRVPLDQGPVLRQLEIFADLETGWMRDFLYGPSEHNEENISLKTVGVIDPARNGDFEITVPDFSRDPSFASYAASGRNYGLIKLRLYDANSGMNLGTIVPLDGLEPGLKVQPEYADTVVFKVVR